MKQVFINPISLSIVYIEVLSWTWFLLGIATWFLYEYLEEIYLVTNRHVFTWRHQDTWRLLSETWAEPEKLVLYIPQSISQWNWQSMLKWIKHNLELEINWEKIWKWHSNEKIDVVLLKFNITNWIKAPFKPINKNKLFDFSIEISDQVFVLWYPSWITAWKKLPIWKKWTVASEPSINYEDLPRFIIDTSTREWMSWSPVIWRTDILIWSWENWEMLDDDYFGTHFNFLWIYSWRLYSKDENDNFITQLWVVWKKEVIEDIILWR